MSRKFQKLKEIRTVQLEQKWAFLTCLSPLKGTTCHCAPSCFSKVNRFNILKTEKNCDDTETMFKVEKIKIIGRKKERKQRKTKQQTMSTSFHRWSCVPYNFEGLRQFCDLNKCWSRENTCPVTIMSLNQEYLMAVCLAVFSRTVGSRSMIIVFSP